MVAKKPRVVIIGAGMAGLTAAHRLHNSTSTFDLTVFEASDRVGGRIRTSEFAGVRVEMGATWIHGIGGSPVYSIAQSIDALDSPTPWERMDGFPSDPVTVAEGGAVVDPAFESSIDSLFRTLMDSVRNPQTSSAAAAGGRSIGAYLRRGFEGHRSSTPADIPAGWSLGALEDAVFAMHENTERAYTSADELSDLNLAAESEYREFPDEEITIARGYSRVIETLASALPPGMIQMGKKAEKVEWMTTVDCRPSDPPVKLHFKDGSVVPADHVIVTVSLGVLKSNKVLFSPPLPEFKRDAIQRLGFGLVNKLFMEHEEGKTRTRTSTSTRNPFPFLQLAFDQGGGRKAAGIPRWMRRTTSICPVYGGSKVLLSWVVGESAKELEMLKDEEIVDGVNATLEGFGFGGGEDYGRIERVVRSGWGSDPLFMGSYSYVAVGSSGEDLDLMAEPLPHRSEKGEELKVLFAGEATHRTLYSTTHGAYFSGLREANRLLQHYTLMGGC